MFHKTYSDGSELTPAKLAAFSLVAAVFTVTVTVPLTIKWSEWRSERAARKAFPHLFKK